MAEKYLLVNFLTKVSIFKTKLADIKNQYVRLKEIPFNSETKWMAVLCQPFHREVRFEFENDQFFVCCRRKCVKTFFQDERDNVYFMKGALDRILDLCKYYLNQGRECRLGPTEVSAFMYEGNRIGSLGLRGNGQPNCSNRSNF